MPLSQSFTSGCSTLQINHQSFDHAKMKLAKSLLARTLSGDADTFETNYHSHRHRIHPHPIPQNDILNTNVYL